MPAEGPREALRQRGGLAHGLLPLRPEAGARSVERITGIIQAAGLSSTALALPPSGKSGDTQVSADGLPAVGRTTGGMAGRRVAVVGGATGLLVVLVAVAGSILLGRQVPTHGEVVQTPAAPSGSQAVPAQAPSASAASGVDAAVVMFPPAVAPATAAAAAAPDPAAAARKKPAAHGATTPVPPAASKPAISSPCKLVKTLDANGEPHFTCPCATCS